MALDLRENTQAQFIAALRERFRDAQREKRAVLGIKLLYWLDLNDLDEDEVRAAFGYTQSEWAAFVNDLRKLATAYALVQDAEGG